MDETTEKTIEELIEQLQSLSMGVPDILDGGIKPYIIHVAAKSINMKKCKTAPEILYKLCSSCYNIINTTWDHSTWCELYEEEALSAWIKKGKK